MSNKLDMSLDDIIRSSGGRGGGGARGRGDGGYRRPFRGGPSGTFQRGGGDGYRPRGGMVKISLNKLTQLILRPFLNLKKSTKPNLT